MSISGQSTGSFENCGRIQNNEAFIVNALRQQIEEGGPNRLAFPLDLKISKDGLPDRQITEPNTIMRYSQKYLNIEKTDSSAIYSLKNVDVRKVTSQMRNEDTKKLKEYHNYTTNAGRP